MKISFRMTAKQKKALAAFDSKKFQAAMDKHFPKATLLNAHIMQAEVRKAIQAGLYAPNAALTIAIKKSDKPLVDSGHGIFQAISVEKITDYRIFVGVLRGSESYNIALALHDGAKVPVTDTMRGMFYVLWQASEGRIPSSELTGRAKELWARKPGGWKPLKASTTAIIIPARPFMEKPFSDPKARAIVKANWNAALAASFKDLASL